MNEIQSFQIDSDDLLTIYICMYEYANIIREKNPEGTKRIIKTKDKIWNQLNKELKEKIDPIRYDREKWQETINALDHLDDR